MVEVHGHGKFIGNLVVASLMVMVMGSFSSLPILIFSTWYHWWTLIIAFGLYALEIVALYQLYRYFSRQRQRSLPVLAAKISWATLIKAGVALIGVLLLAVVDQWITADGAVASVENMRLLDRLFSAHPVAMTISGCFFAPICEELIFRGIFTSYATVTKTPQRNARIVILIVSSLLFGLAHTDPSNPVQYGYYVLMGAILGSVYWFSGDDIRIDAGVHGLANLMMIII